MSGDELTRNVIARGISMLRDGEHYAAHECFEDAWRSASGSERTLFHALAQFSAMYHQLARGRARAAARTWAKVSAKLASIGSLSIQFQSEVETFLAKYGVAADGPRFLDEKRLPQPETWPLPKELLPSVSE